MMASAESNRFQSDAAKYAAYLETPEGRLRLDLAFANLLEFIGPAKNKASLRALDVGCGTGAMAVRLARLGLHVSLLDSSPAMLELAQDAAREAGVAGKTASTLGDAARSTDYFPAASFDLILCHNILEYVDDPSAVLRAAARLLRDSSATLSVLVRNQPGEVLKAAIQEGDLSRARDALNAEWGQEALYGGKVRVFTQDELSDLLEATSFEVIGQRGVRVIADYLPPKVSRKDEHERIFELECKLGAREEFAAIARYAHSFARRVFLEG